MTDQELDLILDKYKPVQDHSEIKRLYHIVEKIEPKTIVEIGVGNGGTFSLWSTLLGKDDRLVGIDLSDSCKWDVNEAECNVKHLVGDSHCPVVVGRTMDALKERPVDFLFIDGDHTSLGARKDYVHYSMFVPHGGIIAFHSIASDECMKAFWDSLRIKKYEIIESMGIGFIVKETT